MEAAALASPEEKQSRPGLCCLACALEDLDVEKAFIITAVLLRTNLEGVLKDSYIKYLIGKMTPSKQKAVLAVFDSLIDVQGRIVHPLYFQRESLPIAFSDEDAHYNFEIGYIQKGQILEIFQASNASFYTQNVLPGLVEEGMELDWKRLGVRWLRFRYPNTVVWISTLEGVLHYTWHDGRYVQKKSVRLQHGLENLDDLFKELQGHLHKIDSVSVIIVDKINREFPEGKMDYNPCAQQWINFFASTYGDTAGLFLVFAIVYEDYLKVGVKSKVEVQKLVNRNLVVRGNVKCLDLSSSTDKLPEEEGNINMDFFAPPE